MEFQLQNMGENSPEMRRNDMKCMELSRNANLGTRNGPQLCQTCTIWTCNAKTEDRQSQKMHFHSYKHGQTASIGMAKMACKNRGQERGNEVSDIRKIQTEKFPSTTQKRDQKYEYLQYMAASKSVYKHDRNVMQNKAQQWL